MNEASAQARFRVRVLGPVVVESASGGPAAPGGARSKALVVALALSHGPRSAGGLVDDIWGEAPPRNERASLQTLVSRVRALASEGLIVSTPGGYALGIDPRECDLAAAQQALEDGRVDAGADWPAVATRTGAALALWRGEPGADLGDTELSAGLADLAGGLLRDLTVLHARALLEEGDGSGTIADLAPLAGSDPLDEEIELLRLRAIGMTGTRNDALREFERFRRRLREELGTDPSAEMRALQGDLLRPSGRESGRTLRVGLRASPNTLLGRDGDIDAVERLMSTSRLTTILGTGGLGKTRLAQELASRATEETPGVVVAELAGVRAGEEVATALAGVLGARDRSAGPAGLSEATVDVRSRILRALGEQPTLLVVDNCEHIVDAVARWVDDIVSALPSVRVLATSRAPLMIAAEHVYQLGPLSSTGRGGDRGPAVSLLIDRAMAARPSASLPTATVARLCKRLDGLPLAIELAAARVRTMSVEEIERRLGDRFSLLRGGDRAAPRRHRTLGAVMAWSWNLLSPSEQRSLRRLSVFVDGFGAEAARVVAGSDDVEADLEGLVNQSLLTARDVPGAGHVRYRMLETVREFAADRSTRSEEDEEVPARLGVWADDLCREALGTIPGPGGAATFRTVEEEQDNLMAVLRSSISVGKAGVVASVFAVLRLHQMMGGTRSEVGSLASQVLDALRRYRPDEDHRDPTVLALALIGATSLVDDAGIGLRALARMRALVARRPPADPRIAAVSALMAGLPRIDRVAVVAEELRGSGIPLVSTLAHLVVSQIAENAGDVERALAEGLAAHRRSRAAEDRWASGVAAQTVAQLYSEAGRPARALEWVGRCRSGLDQVHVGEGLTQLDWIEAMSQVALGRHGDAEEAFGRLNVLETGSQEIDATGFRAIGLIGLAEVAASRGEPARWQRLYEQAERVWGRASAGAGSWWYYGAASGVLVSSAVNGTASDPATSRIARRVRRRLILVDRLRPAGMIDRPMSGLAALGLAVWLLAPEEESTRPQHAMPRGEAQELLVLSHAIGARQDFPSLSWARVTGLVSGWYPGLDLAGAGRQAGALTLTERGDRLVELLRRLGTDIWRRPPAGPAQALRM